MTVQGRVQNGTIVLEDSVTLPEGTRVEVAVITEPVVSETSKPAESLFDRLRDVVGIASDGLPDDLAPQHDHYAHGTPKR